MFSINHCKHMVVVALVVLPLFWVLAVAQESATDGVADDEKLLRTAGVPVDGKGLLGFLKRQVPTAGDEKEAEAFFRQLDSASFKERQRASQGLIALGPKMVPVLQRLLQPGPSLEVRRRAEACILAVQKKYSPEVTAAAVRLVKVRKPADACAALLEFAPFAPDALVAEEVLDTLTTVGIVNKQAEPALQRALRDPHAKRRDFAAVLVGRYGTPDQRKIVGTLLDDKDFAVRFRAAQGLVGAGTREALPVLVDCLRQGPKSLAEQAEEILIEAAGKTAPKIRFAAEGPAREKCHEAWKGWLKENQAKVDLSKLEAGLPAGNPNLRARGVVQDMFDMALKKKVMDTETTRRLTELPYYVSGLSVINTRKEWDDFIQKQQGQKLPDGLKLTFTSEKVLTVTQYLAKADAKEKEFLSRYPRSQMRVVEALLEINFMGNRIKSKVSVFVRVRGARARIVGTGHPDAPMINK